MADRPASETDEIEITPEMIEAGIGALVSYDPRFDLEEDAVKKIFLVMAAECAAFPSIPACM